MNITCLIDNVKIAVKKDSTILEAARKAGIQIPTLCHLDGFPPFTSCMICLVRDKATGKLVPACSTRVKEGMDIDTMSETVRKARQDTLNLLLSEHTGECLAPCTRTCPVQPDIPKIIRYIKAGKIIDAYKTWQMKNPFPAITGHICPAPCEKTCRRSMIDAPVSIRFLEKYTGVSNLTQETTITQSTKKKTGKKVAVVGTGPAGLSAAYFIGTEGHSCILFEKEIEPGGAIRGNIPPEILPREILDNEITRLQSAGITIQTGTRVEKDLALSELHTDYDAVILATGKLQNDDTLPAKILNKKHRIIINKDTFQTDIPGIFACGACVMPMSMAIRAIAQGKQAAYMVHRYLLGKPLEKMKKEFNSTIKKYTQPELMELLKSAYPVMNKQSKSGKAHDLTEENAKNRAGYCLHCDCYKREECMLKKYADEFQADQYRHPRETRKPFQRRVDHPFIVREISKCIKCGRCVRLTEHNEYGFCFTDRGYETDVVIPFDLPLQAISEKTAKLCVMHCPTGALSFKGE